MAFSGARLKGLREQKRISREELADALGLSYWAIAKYEIGERTPDPATLQRLADYFDTTTDYLLGRTDDPMPPGKSLHEVNMDYSKNESDAKDLLNRTHPQIVDLLKRVPDLTEDEQESLAEHWEWAMKVIEKERERRKKFKDKE